MRARLQAFPIREHTTPAHDQNTGASLRNNLPSSPATHLATAFAAATIAALERCGDVARYSSNGLVTCIPQCVSRARYSLCVTYPGQTRFVLCTEVDQSEWRRLPRARVDRIVELMVQRDESGTSLSAESHAMGGDCTDLLRSGLSTS